MAKDPRKRQKQLERRKAKDKARKRALVAHNAHDLADQIRRAASAPVLHSLTTSVLFDEGLSQVLVSRALSNGNVAFAVFLVDAYCLGVKNVICAVASRARYDRDMYQKAFLDQPYEIIPLAPEAARKLVEGAVDYAADLGFAPHRDYRTARLIFGDIDAGACADRFAYGRKGKPCFISGPHDSPSRCREIINILTGRRGPGGFDVVIRLHSPPVSVSGGESRIVLPELDDDEEYFIDEPE